ncbi:helix-turn-helix transcriptional regulator [Flexivirga oryzae]|uniref:DNA-binding PadR family transcriptional regulator n=1 Tax=Flexivirga oryzae TaxID=1794944 RepID=A0A839N3J3_9MICO|nr:DNA-binding PadR family transcriptional regulator [Flexivirga oryzae]
MVSVLGYALLGLLARAPSTGYDLTRVLDRDLSYFWSARHSQIYPELARLERGDHVRHTVISGAGPRPTKRYEITARGRDALTAWLVGEPEESIERNPTMLRISSLWLIDRAAARQLLDGVRRRSTDRLSLYRRFAAEFDAEPGSADPSQPAFATRATLEAGIRSQEARLAWCDWLQERLEGSGR